MPPPFATTQVTPTAVSHQIKLLEAYCGQALF
jgi:DNA-binding transcriptional LysR family regulator